MQSIRTNTRLLPQLYRTASSTSTPTMSLFQDIHPIFRLVNDFERASRTPDRCTPRRQVRTFQPKFDVKELQDSYVLQGELPGIDQKDISIEWADASTITIKGHSEHRVVKASTPAATPAPHAAPEAAPESKESEYQKPTVEEEEGEHSDDFVEVDSHTADTTSTATVQNSEETVAPKAAEEPAESAKYWISERSVGSFSRAFSFPIRVENEAVTASLKNGILSVVVPKAKIPEPRRINIE
jgi:HSP20 family protein